ncbi:hypothetical protein [Azorhizobium doebereinerae]|uniref:hypothetical protein n=1 Tax=Azorhizobium doebereinerae TaxID=281091 RepID=UPI0012EC3C8D|nr:hypothetical protein [Azorhizobium doebereinerae]
MEAAAGSSGHDTKPRPADGRRGASARGADEQEAEGRFNPQFLLLLSINLTIRLSLLAASIGSVDVETRNNRCS